MSVSIAIICFTALCYASGMAAITTVTHLLKAGDHVIIMDGINGGEERCYLCVTLRYVTHYENI